ncbi:tagatose 1,6-diphosphate aldolase [Chelativorans sp. AA-79]|uniref:tagatose 1,6-diphosphate aldolase n=1 Tax=Chelativorans sp. AA-79 TaxID=3028735 RepID=UPI0023F82D3D|nr:tagatose 1,6-diphosphate aldolase [Chelativorans sp. AA-79]WEX09835.1 tagatose 1,6-diphosphate aldolase [Chelativorans sp. AA-79]
MSTIGKSRGLTRLADEDGYFTMVALDQRPPLISAIAKAKSIAPEDVTFADMLSVKRLLVKALAEDASSMLLDPNFAIPAAIDVLPSKTGFIVTLEDHRFEETSSGRKSRAIDNWSVEKIRRIGGDAVKVLAWYRPDAGEDVIAHQQAFVRTIGKECRRYDIPYVLELLVYPFPDSAAHTTGYVESPDKKAALVIESVREFAKPDYGVDLFKLETPVPAASLPAMDGSPATQSAANAFAEIGGICREAGIPWVLLSGGATPEQFDRVLGYSYAAGAQGFLAGRTIWLDAVQEHFPDKEAVLHALDEVGRKRLSDLKALTRKKANPWKGDFRTTEVSFEGDFAASYA